MNMTLAGAGCLDHGVPTGARAPEGSPCFAKFVAAFEQMLFDKQFCRICCHV